MYSKFLNLSKEKQNKIINAALNIFSSSIYKNASTDEIVKSAGISKGSLFHYFKSKEDLYLYLYDYSVGLFKKDFYSKIDLNERDIFKKFSNITSVKLELVRKHPDIFNFVYKAMYFEDNPRLKKEINKRNDSLVIENYNKFFTDIDKSRFRNDIDPNKAIELIILTMNGYASKEALNVKPSEDNEDLYNKWIREVNEYTEIMKKIYYKGE